MFKGFFSSYAPLWIELQHPLQQLEDVQLQHSRPKQQQPLKPELNKHENMQSSQQRLQNRTMNVESDGVKADLLQDEKCAEQIIPKKENALKEFSNLSLSHRTNADRLQ